jgi:hypothetical protein
MAHRAGLIFLSLIVKAGDSGWTGVHCEGVAFQAEQVDLAAFEQSGIGRAMWDMARLATLNDRFVLIDKWTGFFRVAFEADGILSRRGPQLTRQKSTMRVMAVAALYQPFVHTMVKGSIELLFRFQVAAIAKLRLLLFHQVLIFLRMVR